MTEGRVAVVDGRRGQPAFSALAAAQFVEEVDEGFWSVPLSPSVELFTRVTPIDSVESLLRFMAKIAPNHPHALVDLSGYEEHGTHLRAYDAVDGVLVIAVAGVDKEKALLAKVEPIPEDKRLGVLLATR